LADLEAVFLGLVLADWAPCVVALAACGGAVLALALGGGLVATLGVAGSSVCAQVLWGNKVVKSRDKARGAQHRGLDLDRK
jgi:hypothetical protein